MSPGLPEQQARVEIDKALDAAGWVIQDRAETNLTAGLGVAVREFKMADGHGFADYMLFCSSRVRRSWSWRPSLPDTPGPTAVRQRPRTPATRCSTLVASLRVPSWNQLLGWLKAMDALRIDDIRRVC